LNEGRNHSRTIGLNKKINKGSKIWGNSRRVYVGSFWP